MSARPPCACGLTRGQVAAVRELVNVAASCAPCDSGSGNCKLHNAVMKSLPALNAVLAVCRIDEACHPDGK